MFKSVLVVLSLALFSSNVFADKASDKVAIEAAVNDYFQGQGEASKERLFRAFAAENATMVGVVKDEQGKDVIKSWKDMTTVLNHWSSNENPAGGNLDGEIISLNVVDDRLAVVLFRSTTRFYDALTLAKVNDEWKIIGKSYILQ
ncbi:nuclear transport factor 2 family protein [Alteromonas sp. 5E99-2]|uniref:nuclear transport factor 2 family protein n=1 Tax=Alteromonas sp. 5E99-2 TaxID=2817683 RepID=UPI001A98B838|nr:nuclear transport factor 2 family protein [Alteromonas sp. 5E99-2]MBO1254422.1 nuclear transport factor 2 family protein [Alteromonas sp. 5E99-2]